MKVTSNFEYSLKDKLYRLCNREGYFTCGTNRQYDLMFSMAVMPEMSVRDIAVMIFTCSEKASLGRILSDVQEIMNDIEEAEAYLRMEEEQARGERAADEIYCAYFE